MRTQILFDPAKVKNVLATLPTVEASILDPAAEGDDSEGFPHLRKTKRELYRWIANTHYPHLAEVVPTLERVHSAGCTFGHLLKTRSRAQFVSHIAEVFVAEDLLRRGYSVETVPTSSEVSPDLHVTGRGIDLAVEVYNPRELGAVDDWVREVTDLLSYVDIQASFVSRVSTRDESFPLPLNPWAMADALAQTREQVLAEIVPDVENALRDLRPLEKTYEHKGTPLVTTVELVDVKDGTSRYATFSYPGISGYSPAGVFRTIVERALRKARRRQTEGIAAGGRALVVYLMESKIADDLVVPAHRREAKEVVEEIEPRDYGLDAIAFVVRALPEGVEAIFTVYDDATLTLAQVEALFGHT